MRVKERQKKGKLGDRFFAFNETDLCQAFLGNERERFKKKKKNTLVCFMYPMFYIYNKL